MIQGGASGSPIFLQDKPLVVGLLYGGHTFTYAIAETVIEIDSNITLALPSGLIAQALEAIKNDIKELDLSNVPMLDSLLTDRQASQT